jgi:hypothetical protein
VLALRRSAPLRFCFTASLLPTSDAMLIPLAAHRLHICFTTQTNFADRYLRVITYNPSASSDPAAC